MDQKKGFFDKINNSFFSVIDVFLSQLEERGWNIPEETRFLYHTAIFIFLLYVGFPLIIQYFFYFEAFVILLTIASFCIANIMPIRKFLGYYSNEGQVQYIVYSIQKNKASIVSVARHLGKNLMPPHLTLAIIRAYQEKGTGIPPEIIRLIIRQPQEISIFREIIKEQLNESDFSLLMRKYRNAIPKLLLVKTVETQKMDNLTIRDLLFYQENAYQIINQIGKKAEDEEMMDFVIKEKHKYRQKMSRKNFLRNHHVAISLLVATFIAGLSVPLLIANIFLMASGFALLWILIFEVLYNYGLRELYFKI